MKYRNIGKFTLGLFLATSLYAEDGRVDYDIDDDGLIEINDLSDLDAIRNYDSLDGDSLYGENFGCPTSGCNGFELTQDLDFDTNADGLIDENDTYWNNGKGWAPIHYGTYNFSAPHFEGNGHLIRNLYIDDASQYYSALFTALVGTHVRNLGFAGPASKVNGDRYVGALAGSISSGKVTGVFNTIPVSGNYYVGGLAGHMVNTEVTTVFVTGKVIGVEEVGGIAGRAWGDSDIIRSISTARVEASSRFAGALVGNTKIVNNKGPKSKNVHYSTDTTGVNLTGSGLVNSSLVEVDNITYLQCSDAASTMEASFKCGSWSSLFSYWNFDTYVNQFAEETEYWDFGTKTQLPGLNLMGTIYRDSDGDGSLDEYDDLPFDTDNDGIDNKDDQYPSDFDNDGITDAKDTVEQDSDNVDENEILEPTANKDSDVEQLTDLANAGSLSIGFLILSLLLILTDRRRALRIRT